MVYIQIFVANKQPVSWKHDGPTTVQNNLSRLEFKWLIFFLKDCETPS